MTDNLKLMTDNYIYFHHIGKFLVIPIAPDNISDTMKINFGQQNSLASTAPTYSYINSGPRQINVKLSLHRDMMNDINTNVSNIRPDVVDFKADDYIEILIHYLQSLSLPKFNPWSAGGKTIQPPMVSLRFCNEIFIKGIISSQVAVSYKKPILYNGKYAQVDIQFTVDEVDPYDAETVIALGSFRGITDTLRNGIYNNNSMNVSTPRVNRSDISDVLPYIVEKQRKEISR